MNVTLEHFAKEAGASPTKQIILVLDGAGWHTANDLVLPTGIHLCFLPPYSPELQPAERLWPYINEALANRTFSSIHELVNKVDQRCREMDRDREHIARLTNYHWWPTEPRSDR